LSALSDIEFAERVERLSEFVDRLCSADATIDAVCDDGWPRAMVERGFQMHADTWTVTDVVAAFERELEPFGGVEALANTENAASVLGPNTISHIWPALPGAGVTPVLFGYLLGAEQYVRASSRGQRFARHLVDVWNEVVEEGLEIRQTDWWDVDVVVISGSDETVDEVREIVRERSTRRTRVTGYGHRVSFALVEDEDDDTDLKELAARLATDVVLWHQQGCFSCRAVLFCGGEQRRAAFSETLADAIASVEEELDATDVPEAELARRAQARGTAEFAGRVWGDGVGWTTETDEPWTGGCPSAHAVTIHPVSGPEALEQAVDVPPHHLQGVAMSVPDAGRQRWIRAVSTLGVTRICEPGDLQCPPAGWHHDGRPNILDWVRFVDRDSDF
jgi:hypothetical protein